MLLSILNFLADKYYLLIGLFGLGFIAVGVRSRLLAGASLKWPGTTGRVTESRVEKRSGSESDYYVPVVHYTYSVNGTEFSGQRIAAWAVRSGESDMAQGIAASYPVGKDVTVYYDPVQPEQAFLQRGGNGGWWEMVIGCIALALGVLFFYLD